MSKIETIKNEILLHFDWEKVQKVMEFLNWTWLGNKNSPSINELKLKAMDLVERAYNEQTSYSTGGFIAEYDDDDSVNLLFYVSYWTGYAE